MCEDIKDWLMGMHLNWHHPYCKPWPQCWDLQLRDTSNGPIRSIFPGIICTDNSSGEVFTGYTPWQGLPRPSWFLFWESPS